MSLAELAAAFEAAAPVSQLPSTAERRVARERAGLSVERASALADVSRRSLIEWENGIREPRPRTGLRYRQLLGLCQTLNARCAAAAE